MRRPLIVVVLGVCLASSLVGVGASAAPHADSDEMTTVVVTLRDQADLGPGNNGSRDRSPEQTVRTLKSTAKRSQADIRDLLKQKQEAGDISDRTSLWITNAISVTASPEVIAELAARPDVKSVTPDALTLTPATAPPEPNVSAVHADAMWELGHRGSGVVVASLDSGVDASHPDLAAQWRGGTNSWFDPYTQHPNTPTDLTGHGTATAGVMVGGEAGGTAIGVAPRAKWIAAKIFSDQGTATATAVHQAFQWVLDPDGDPATDDAPEVVNGSWSIGSGPGCDLSFQPDVQALRAAGIVPVFAAGNFGSGGSTSVSPANYPESLSVGAVSSTDVVYSGSSRGPSTCGGRTRVFPDVVAPGVGINAADRYGLYQSVSGTSVAAPHVTGGLALLLGASPALQPGAPENAVTSSAFDLGPVGPDDAYGHGRLDVLAAWNVLQDVPGFRLNAAPESLSVDAGGTADVEVMVDSVNGFVGPVSLVAAGPPAAVGSALLDVATVQGSGSATLHLVISADAPAGTYPVTISGTSGAARTTAVVGVHVPSRDFTLSATPTERTVAAGATTSFRFGIEPVGGFTGTVRLKLSGLPPLTTASLTKKRVSVGRRSKLIIMTSQATPRGTYTLVVRGRSESLTHRTRVTLVVA